MLKAFLLFFILLAVTAIVSIKRKNFGLVDIFWGLGHVVLCLGTLFWENSFTSSAWLLCAAVSLWGLRLAGYLAYRNIGKDEDDRYHAMRKNWEPHANLHAVFKIFLFQGMLILMLCLPLLFAIKQGGSIVTTHIAGAIVFLLGWVLEVVADEQKRRFKSKPENKNRFIQHGVWAISRHPNYLGEAVLWWGIWVMTWNSLPWYYSIHVPIIVTVLVRFVSGVPLLEKRYVNRPGFEAYRKKTPKFLPKPLGKT